MNDCIRFNRPKNLPFQKSVYENFLLLNKAFFFLHQWMNIFRKKEKWKWTGKAGFRNKSFELQLQKSHRIYIWTIFLSNSGIRTEIPISDMQDQKLSHLCKQSSWLKIMFYACKKNMSEEVLYINILQGTWSWKVAL